MGVRRALLAFTGGAWRFVQWDGAAWREASSPKFTVDAPDGRTWLRLRCADEGARATKLWTLGPAGWTKEAEAPGTWFALEAVWVEDSAEAWAELFRAWEGDAGAFLVRGVLARGVSFGAELVRRAKVADKGAWLGPHPVGRRVLVLDFDGLDHDGGPERGVPQELPGLVVCPHPVVVRDGHLHRTVLTFARFTRSSPPCGVPKCSAACSSSASTSGSCSTVGMEVFL